MDTKIAFITDLHLKDKEKYFLKNKRQELLKKFVEEDIVKKSITHVVFGGDMFDQVSVETSNEITTFFFRDIVGKIVNKGIKTDLLVGNHERKGKRHLYEMLDKSILSKFLSVRDTITFESFKDFNAIYIPYIYPSDFNTNDRIEAEKLAYKKVETLANELSKNKLPVIVFNHNLMGGLWFENEKELDIKFYEIPSVDFVLGGHIHKQIKFNKGLYVGSFMRSFTYEEEDEGYYILTIDKNKQLKHEYVPLKSFEYEKVVIESDKSSNIIFNKNHVYSIDFVFKNDNKDNFFVSNILKIAEKSGAFIKTFKIKKSNENKIIQKVISNANSKEEILKAFLKRDGIDKSEYDSYFKKLSECSEKIKKIKTDNSIKLKKIKERNKNVELKNIMKEKILEYTNKLVNDEFAF